MLGATGKQFDALNAKAKLLGRTTSYTAAQVAGAMLELGRAGFDALQIDASIEAVLALARATGTELPTAANIAAGALRAFNLEADQMGRVADVMTATANNSAQTLEDLGEAMKYAAPVADAYGLSLEETTKILGALANFSIRASMAGNVLKNIMLQLANSDVRAKLKALGVDHCSHLGSSVATSSRTQVSTMVAAMVLTPGELQDIVSGHLDVRLAPEATDDLLASGIRTPHLANDHLVALFDELNFRLGPESVFLTDLLRNGDLSLDCHLHGRLPGSGITSKNNTIMRFEGQR